MMLLRSSVRSCYPARDSYVTVSLRQEGVMSRTLGYPTPPPLFNSADINLKYFDSTSHLACKSHLLFIGLRCELLWCGCENEIDVAF
jgi:hypothetical protein